MKILALEFSSDRRSAAVVEATPRAATRALGRASESRAASVAPLQLIDEALKGAGVARTEIEVIAVGRGPGSYAGIRSGISIAQGWQLARGVRLLGVSSVECVAEVARQGG